MDPRNIQLAAEMTQVAATEVRAHRHLTASVFRYNLSADTEVVLTKVAALIANRAAANVFPDEPSARAAIRKAQSAADPPPA